MATHRDWLRGLTEPSRTSAGAPVDVAVHNPTVGILVELGEEERILDDSGKLRILYVTTNEPEDVALRGRELTGVVHISATIDRDDLRQFSERLIDLLLAELPTIIANVLRDLTQAVVNGLREKLVELTRARASVMMYVTYHKLEEEIEEVESQASDTHCLVGNYEVLNLVDVLSSANSRAFEGRLSVISASGRWLWSFHANGSCTMSYDNLTFTTFDSRATSHVNYGGTTVFTGTAEGTYEMSGNNITINFGSSTVVGEADGFPIPFTAAHVSQEYRGSTFACGDPAIINNFVYGDIHLGRVG